jgi:group II intron reverse transcriptase/maturase
MKDWEDYVQTSLSGIAKKAKAQPKYRFRNLYGMLNEKLLADSWLEIKKSAASGVDGVSAGEFEKNLEGNIRDLVEDLKGKRYRAKLVRRKYIPKGQGKMRPLGIPATRDKLLQLAVARILRAIWEPEFMRCSYGYRPGVGARDAVHQLTVKLQFGNYNYVVEADIHGFFDHVSHQWMVRMLEQRIDDKPFIRLIVKWLKAGVLEEDGRSIIKPQAGVPQGGIVSPVLANVYLHYVIDLWFHRVFLKTCRGEGCMIRYADDCIWAFEREEEAERFCRELKARLAKFALELSQEKSRTVRFDRDQPQQRFEFLGFEFYWSRDRNGRPHVKKRTSRKRMRRSLRAFTDWIKAARSMKLADLIRKLNGKLRGYFNYYGVIGNYRSLYEFFCLIRRALWKWLSRRSGRARLSWAKFARRLERFPLQRPSINQRRGRRSRTALCLYW